MKAAAVLLLSMAMATPQLKYFRYQRPVQMATPGQGQACLALDGTTFVHAAPGLTDLRLYRNGAEIPYLLHQAVPPQEQAEMVAPLNAGMRGNAVVFDVEMPAGRYRQLEMVVEAVNYVATVTVSGSQKQNGAETRIGTYTIFDLTRQKLGRGSMLELPASDYRYLHFRIKGPVRAENIRGIRVTREASERARYVQVAQTGMGVTKGQTTELTVEVPAHLPVERIVFTPAAQPALFSRTVRVTAVPLQGTPEHPAVERLLAQGSLLRLHGVQQGQRIDKENLAIETPREENAAAERWTVAIDNGNDAPLAIESARLEMVERDLCFDPGAGGAVLLNYGDVVLDAPRYDYGALTAAQANAIPAALGVEIANPSFRPRPDERPITEKSPWLLWAVLIGAIGLLGLLTLRTVKAMRDRA